MTSEKIESRLKNAVENITPDIKTRVLEKCRETDKSGDRIIVMKDARNRKREMIYRFITVAALVPLVLNVSADIIISRAQRTVETVVDIDVNPGIELHINRDDKIISAIAVNDDGAEILDGMDLSGTQTRVAVNAIIGSMFEHGYLMGETDSILVSVTNKDPEKSDVIKETISGDIDSLMSAYNREVNVISQVVCDDEELNAMALSYGISIGKASLIRNIIETYGVYTAQDLVYLNITELNEIICGFETEDVQEDKPVDTPESPGEPDPQAPTDEDMPGNDTAYYEDESVSENSISENDVSVSENQAVTGDAPAVTDNGATGDEADPEGAENRTDGDDNTVSSNEISEENLQDTTTAGN